MSSKGGRRPVVTLAAIQARCAERGCECLTSAYVNAHAPMRFRCLTCAHEWDSNANRMTNGKGCPACWGDTPYTLDDLNTLAASRGGLCLSTAYGGAHGPHQWRCALGHEWRAKWNDVRKATWCPQCNKAGGVGERLCRAIMEQIFSKPFTRTRPKDLLSARGTPLELDGYNAELQIAFEHQGQQHTDPGHVWMKGKSLWLQDNDAIKRRWCHERGVLLIEIPEVPGSLEVDAVPALIRSVVTDAGRYCPPTSTLNLTAAYSTTREVDELESLRALAASRGGQLLSQVYGGSRAKHEWKCGVEAHMAWSAAPYSIKAGVWCPQCGSVDRWASRRTNGTDAPSGWMGRGRTMLQSFPIPGSSPYHFQHRSSGTSICAHLLREVPGKPRYLIAFAQAPDFTEGVLSLRMSGPEVRGFWSEAQAQVAALDLRLLVAMPDDSHDGWRNRIQSLISEAPTVTGARSCTVGTCSTTEATAFYTQHHVQGGGTGMTHHALRTRDGRLVAVMSFAPPFANRSCGADLLLTRFAVDGHVPGAASRLLAAARTAGQSILTFSDNRYASGAVYERLGFKQAGAVEASYRYVRNGRVYSKESLQRKVLIKILGLHPDSPGTEAAMAREACFQRLYDAGKVRWLLS